MERLYDRAVQFDAEQSIASPSLIWSDPVFFNCESCSWSANQFPILYDGLFKYGICNLPLCFCSTSWTHHYTILPNFNSRNPRERICLYSMQFSIQCIFRDSARLHPQALTLHLHNCPQMHTDQTRSTASWKVRFFH
jgi:hypothetical protein